MPRIRLELEELRLDRPKKRWNIYFVIATPHPLHPDRYAVSMLPQPIAPLRRPADNLLDFVATGNGADGLEVLERDMPPNRSVEVLCWVMHSRRIARHFGDIIDELADSLSVSATPILGNVLGRAHQWVAVARGSLQSLGAIGSSLRSIRDRNLGFVNLGEQFGPEFERETELDRSNTLSTGFGELVWTWTTFGPTSSIPPRTP
ncbi:MAG: hypothetical protein B7733_02265 [Myxococcales bacterium FL481]|nr:MAG: hypothetical protein B7733_02265 [Myxococcales bacterium FL481]